MSIFIAKYVINISKIDVKINRGFENLKKSREK
jgi:hypothetical protein